MQILIVFIWARKDVFKVIVFTKVIISEKILSNIQVLNFYFNNNIQDFYMNKVHEQRRLVEDVFNNKKKYFMLIHLPKIDKVSSNMD